MRLYAPAGLRPTTTGIIPGPSVKGTVWTKCDEAPTTHDLTIHLQRRVNGAWVDQATKTSGRIPPPIALYTLATAPCVPGEWRVTYSIEGIGDGHPFQASGTGETVEVTPGECG